MSSDSLASASPFRVEKTAPGGSNVDQIQFGKLAERVEGSLTNFSVYAEPKQIPPGRVYVCPNNRDGSAPNVMSIHKGILGSIKHKGFDRRRPQAGICVMYTSTEGKRRLLEHNHRFTKGNPLLPQMFEDSGPLYGSLSCSHFNLALRCIKEGVQGPQGDLSKLLSDSKYLEDFVHGGHTWWVLQEEVPKDRQCDISTWKNQDQNENQQAHEVELLQTIRSVAEGCVKSSRSLKSLPLGDLSARAAKRNPTRQSAAAMMGYVKYYDSFVKDEQPHLVAELSDYHSAVVDPKEVTMPVAFFNALTTPEANLYLKTPFLRHYLVLTQYTTDKVRESETSNVAQFLEVRALENLAKKPDQVAPLEKLIADLRFKHLPVLEETLGSGRAARQELAVYIDLILRCLFSKPWPQNLLTKCPVATGKYSEAKVAALGVFWGGLLKIKYPDENLPEKLGLKEETRMEADQEDKGVDLEALRKLTRTSSTPSEPEPQKDLSTDLKRGDEVTVTTRTGVGVEDLLVEMVVVVVVVAMVVVGGVPGVGAAPSPSGGGEVPPCTLTPPGIAAAGGVEVIVAGVVVVVVVVVLIVGVTVLVVVAVV